MEEIGNRVLGPETSEACAKSLENQSATPLYTLDEPQARLNSVSYTINDTVSFPLKAM